MSTITHRIPDRVFIYGWFLNRFCFLRFNNVLAAHDKLPRHLQSGVFITASHTLDVFLVVLLLFLLCLHVERKVFAVQI